MSQASYESEERSKAALFLKQIASKNKIYLKNANFYYR
jgi:hypothetical protein